MPTAVDIGPSERSTGFARWAGITPHSCHPIDERTMSPTENLFVLLYSTLATTSPCIMSPGSSGVAYEGPDRILPRMYGSTDRKSVRVRTSPAPGSGIGELTSLKSSTVGKPVGRAASVIW